MKIVLFFLTFLAVHLSSFSQESALGKIQFINSGSAEVQEYFVKGVLLLHSFEYEDAAEAFIRAQEIDSTFALAYWGEAMTYNHTIWMQQDYQKGLVALNKLSNVPNERVQAANLINEKGLMQAINILYGEGDKNDRDIAYMEYMEMLYNEFPEDNEIAAFYCLSILGTCHNGRDLEKYKKAAAIGEVVLARNQGHPGALHYLIHSYDDPVSAHLGLKAADLYAQVAPAAAHALHMPSHIYLAMGMWDKVVSSNIASSKAAEARMERKELGLQAKGYHSLWWLEYGYLQQGKYRGALRILNNMYEDWKKEATARTTWHLVAERGHFLIETNDWEHDVAYWDIDTDEYGLKIKATNEFVMGLKAAKSKSVEEAEHHFINLITIINENINPDSERDLEAWLENQDINTPTPDEMAALIMEKELEAMIFYLGRSGDLAEKAMQVATRAEENTPFMFGPPAVMKPSHELYGEMLLEWRRPSEAKYEFQKSLERVPNRTRSLIGLAKSSKLANDLVTEKAALNKLKEIWKDADRDMAVYD
jgi:tetratricopeptide (TPR) repeat protein